MDLLLSSFFVFYFITADTKPGCVLRAANIVPLLQQDRKLLTDDEINACKNSFNTWAFVGDINNRPQLTNFSVIRKSV